MDLHVFVGHVVGEEAAEGNQGDKDAEIVPVFEAYRVVDVGAVVVEMSDAAVSYFAVFGAGRFD